VKYLFVHIACFEVRTLKYLVNNATEITRRV